MIDPARRQAVEDIFTWRTVLKLGVPTITLRLIADPAAYPPPEGGWSEWAVRVILGNPKHTGHQVFGRRRTRDGRRYDTPADQWLWTPEPVHERIIDMDTWKTAQDAGAEHASSRDTDDAGPNPRNPRHQAAAPGHPRSVQAPETLLDAMTGEFFRERIFTPGRTELLGKQLPASAADAAARRDQAAAALAAPVSKLDAQQAAQIRALEDVPRRARRHGHARPHQRTLHPAPHRAHCRREKASRPCYRSAQGRRPRHLG